MLNAIWAGMIVLGILYGAFTGNLEAVSNAALESAGEAVDLCITMCGIMGLWTGLMKIAQQAGLIAALTRGIKWDVEGVNKDSWGYGDGPRTEEEFLARYKGLTDVLLDNPKMFGFCYTQLYDVEQEMNGLYTYGRKPKFDMEIIRRINSRKAAIEEGEA